MEDSEMLCPVSTEGRGCGRGGRKGALWSCWREVGVAGGQRGGEEGASRCSKGGRARPWGSALSAGPARPSWGQIVATSEK